VLKKLGFNNPEISKLKKKMFPDESEMFLCHLAQQIKFEFPTVEIKSSFFAFLVDCSVCQSSAFPVTIA